MQTEPTGALALTGEQAPASPITSAAALAAAFLAGHRDVTRRAYAADLAHWDAFLAQAQVEALEAHRVHVDAYVRECEQAGLAPSTIARRLTTLAGFYAYAVDEQLIARSPVERVRRPTVREDSPQLGLDRDELARLLTAAEASSARDHALVCLLALNGLRVSEAVGADVEHLDHQRGHQTLELTRKGGRKAIAPLAPRTAQAIATLLAGRTEGPIFATRTGRRVDRHAAAKTVRRLARKAGVAHRASPHSLRHGFITAALDAGVSLRDVQDAAGHADPRTTRRYDRGRHSLDRHATYAVASFIAS